MNKAKLKRRLIIGSANFDYNYGVIPSKINPKEINKILNLAKKNSIFKIDTADSYFRKKNIFKNINKKFKIITKIKPDHKWQSIDFCYKKMNDHLNKFNSSSVQTVLFHDTDILFSAVGKKIFKNIEILKKKKLFKKIGISIYDVKCLKYLISNFDIDVVQCPYNILDKRIIISGWLNKLKLKRIEIHVRSVFLQGILLNNAVFEKKYFMKWKKEFYKWFNSLEKNNISPLDYCLNDLLDHDFDQVIIGINNYNNLKEIINFKVIKNKNKISNFRVNDLKLIDPRNWKLNEN